MEKRLTCIVCPMGCDIKIKYDENLNIEEVSGNTCPRGEKYARNELINPQRTVTSTVKCSNGKLVSVKTDGTIPKSKMSECMKIINNKIADLPISVGDVIIENVFGSNVIATKNMK